MKAIGTGVMVAAGMAAGVVAGAYLAAMVKELPNRC